MPFKRMALALCLIGMGAYGQKQTKTYNESFKVNEATVLDINTSHADIAFETWDRPEVQIEAVIELDGVSDANAEKYFQHEGFQIMGNSKKITVSTSQGKRFFWGDSFGHGEKFQFDFPDLAISMDSLQVKLDSLQFNFDFIADIPELVEMPPMPHMPVQHFDYEAFKKDGEKYMKKWQKEFSKGFDKEYEKKMEEWGKRMSARQEEMQKKMEKTQAKRMESQQKLIEKRAEQQVKRAESHAKRAEAQANRVSHNIMRIQTHRNDSAWSAPNMFYFSSDGESRNYKVKKTLKIKMPKAMKIQMNVRHGEVKLAGNTKNLNAKLSYVSLLASTIDGDATIINASYSPVTVQKWNYGQLQTHYSQPVNIKEARNLRLSATSSDVVIDQLLQSAFITNDFGPIKINSIANGFKELDVSMKNAELDCNLPSAPFTVYVKGTSSTFSAPETLSLEKTKNLNSFVHKGHHLNAQGKGSITINSEYGHIALKQ